MAMDWDKLRVFYAVAQAGSFTRAGESLNLSQSAVSRQISALEDSLNVSLFHRHARGLILTEQGDILYQTVKEVFARLAKAENAITESKERPKGPLRVAAQLSFGAVWLAPIIREFVETYPEISVSLLAEEREFDLAMREADVAIRLFVPKQPDLVHRPLMTMHHGVYASTAYLKKHGVPAEARDLDQHQLICFVEGERMPYADINWLMEEGARPGVPRKAVLKVNNMLAMLEAVESGLGIASLPTYMVTHSKSITRILENLQGPKTEAFFVYPSELRHSKRLKVFRDFILRKVSETVF